MILPNSVKKIEKKFRDILSLSSLKFRAKIKIRQGYSFSTQNFQVVLIHKVHPEFQGFIALFAVEIKLEMLAWNY